MGIILATNALASCDADRDSKPHESLPSPHGSPRPTPAANQGVQLIKPNHRSQLLVGSATSVPWELLASSTDTVLVVRVQSGGCFQFTKAVVSESKRSVLVAGLAQDNSVKNGEPQSCTGNLISNDVPVPLRAPLGSRQLLHAPISAVWKQGR